MYAYNNTCRGVKFPSALPTELVAAVRLCARHVIAAFVLFDPDAALGTRLGGLQFATASEYFLLRSVLEVTTLALPLQQQLAWRGLMTGQIAERTEREVAQKTSGSGRNGVLL